MNDIKLNEIIGFDWDHGNINKNSEKHGVVWQECEEVFFNDPLLFFEDIRHSEREKRAFVLGKTNEARKIFVAFTIRNQLVRVISARDMNKKERAVYENTCKKNT